MGVRMQYSALPTGQDIEVAEASVATYERMGWTVVGDRPSTKTSETEAQSRRRTPKEND